MVTVVGAVAIDMIAVRERFLEGTSNPSDIRLGLGGVGWRIFSNLEPPRRFITALATDPISRWAREALEADGDAVIQEVRGEDSGPPLYLALMESGNLKVAASDFRIVEQSLSPAFVERHLGSPGARDFLVLDANLSADLLSALIRRHGTATRVVFEPVSVEKARRHAGALRDIFLMTPTEEEMEALAPGGDRTVAAWMAERGVAHVLVTRGERGATLHSGGAAEDLPPGTVIGAGDTTGAGDLLVALLLSRLHGSDQPGGMAAAVRSAMRAVEERLARGGM